MKAAFPSVPNRPYSPSVSDEYWSIDIPGLTEEQALRMREQVLSDAQSGVILSDPKVWMVRGYDRATVELLRKCLLAGLAQGTLDHADAHGAQSMVEDCETWLAQAER